MKNRHLTLLCGFSALVVSQVIYALPAEDYKASGRFKDRASAQSGPMASAYFGPEEDEAEDQAEDEAEAEAEEEAEKQAEEEAEKQAEEEAEKQAEEEAEKQAEEEAEKQAEEEAEKQAEEEAEKQAEEEAEDLAEELEDAAEDAAKEAEDAAEDAADEAEDAAEDAAEEAEDAADQLEAAFEQDDDDLRDDDDDMSESLDVANEQAAEASGDGREEQARGDRDERLDDGAFTVAERLVAERDYFEVEEEFGAAFVADEVLLLAERDVAEAIDLSAFEERKMEYLPGLDMVLVRARRTEAAELQGDIDALSAALENGAVDRNHLYAPENSVGNEEDEKSLPASMAKTLGFDAHQVPGLAIGLIDTAIEMKHPLFAPGTIIAEDFVSYDAPRPKEHGTAVASILVGQSPTEAFGLLPGATLYSASVFLETSKGHKVATAESLVRALDWMLRSKVNVVNMSLSGPQNELLEVAVRRSIDRGMTVVAAVGNAGPGSAPLYPAAIDPVVAVTAVDFNGRVFLRANRGVHVDLSAPGVSVFAGNASGGVVAKTGTSIASPFVAAMLAQLAQEKYEGEVATAFEAIKAQATDLGKPGFDETYGYGLARTNSE